MPAPRPTASLLGSLALHALVTAGLALANRRGPEVPRRPAAVVVSRVDFEATPPPPAAPPTTTPPAPAPAPAPQPRERATVAARVRATTPAAAPRAAPVEAPATPTEPAPRPAGTTPGNGTPALSATEILRATQSMPGQWVLTTPGHGGRGAGHGRGAGRGEGTSPERLREIAMAPTLAALEGSRHGLPAGTVRHDRAVARRAAEAFSPVRQVPGLGSAVRRAAVHTLPTMVHSESPGEAAAIDNLDAEHGFALGHTRPGGDLCASYRVLRAELEVDQNADGAITDARVVRTSGLARYDAAALVAMREAMPDVPALAGGAPRRSRWLFEVSDTPTISPTSDCNVGWTVLPEQSDGVRLRVRVRMSGPRPR